VAERVQPGGRSPAPPPYDLLQDFVNTEIPEWARDDIATPALLSEWLRGRDLLEEGGGVGAEAFVVARELRGVLRQLALLNTLRKPPDDELRTRADSVFALLPVRAGLGPGGGVRPVAIGSGATRALAAIVAVALEAQATGAWERLKACRKESCGWLFYDASRNSSSSWCSMSICGNRTKTAAYRRRRRGSGAR